MHVTILCTAGYSMARHRREQILGLTGLGWQVSAIADYTSGSDDEVRKLGAEPVHLRCESLGRSVARNMATIASLARILRARRPDLLHCFGLKGTIHGSIAARVAGTSAVVHTVTGQGVIVGGDRYPFTKALALQLLRGMTRGQPMIFQNTHDMAVFIDKGVVREDCAVYIPGCGVDVSAFGEPPERPDPNCFVQATRMLLSKGIGVFRMAAGIVKARRPDAEFHAFGGCREDYGSDNPDYVSREWLQEMDREGVVKWHGLVPPEVVDQALLYTRTAALVNMSRYPEGVPRIGIEAAAAGLPIITTNTPGCRDVVDHGISGWACDGDSDVALAEQAAEAMLEVLSMTESRRRIMGARSREIAMRFDHSRVMQDTLNLYDLALKNRRYSCPAF